MFHNDGGFQDSIKNDDCKLIQLTRCGFVCNLLCYTWWEFPYDRSDKMAVLSSTMLCNFYLIVMVEWLPFIMSFKLVGDNYSSQNIIRVCCSNFLHHQFLECSLRKLAECRIIFTSSRNSWLTITNHITLFTWIIFALFYLCVLAYLLCAVQWCTRWLLRSQSVPSWLTKYNLWFRQQDPVLPFYFQSAILLLDVVCLWWYVLWSETDSCITMVITVIMSLCGESVIVSQTFSVYNIVHTSMWLLYSCKEVLFTEISTFIQKCSSSYTQLLLSSLPYLLIPILNIQYMTVQL